MISIATTKLSWKGLAGAGAIFWGAYLGLAVLFQMNEAKFWWFQPEIFSFLAQAYPGLAPTFGGLIIGVILGAICGAVCGAIFGWIYNWCTNKLE